MNEIEMFNKIIEVVTQTGGSAIQAYTEWHLASAIICVFCGAIMIAVSLCISTAVEDLERRLVLEIVKVLLIVLGSLFILANAADIFAPKAAAIHQLIKDVRGTK